MKPTAKKSTSKPTKPNNRMLIPDGQVGIWKLRISPRKGTKTRSPSLLVRCGCCDESVEIYYDDDSLSINGVIASLREWKRVLGPILRGKTR